LNYSFHQIGFGRESDLSSSVSQVLKFNTLKAITNQECAAVYLPGLVQDTNLCAATNYQASTCGGDSGGSYIFNINNFKRLEGVTSFGAADGCQLGYPSGFTRVTSYLNWIYYNINGGTTTPAPEVDNIWKIILQKILDILRKIFGRP
jgi:secreted trypsin-like serine protease